MTDLQHLDEQRQERASALGDAIVSVVRAGYLVKHAAPISGGVDHGAVPVLLTVAQQPRRVSDVAAACHTDVSTTSRYVTALAQRGLVDKVPDEQDRRSSLVHVTEEGRRAVVELRSERAQVFADVLHDWDLDDIDTLTAGLQRLVDSVDTYLTHRRTTKGA